MNGFAKSIPWKRHHPMDIFWKMDVVRSTSYICFV